MRQLVWWKMVFPGPLGHGRPHQAMPDRPLPPCPWQPLFTLCIAVQGQTCWCGTRVGAQGSCCWGGGCKLSLAHHSPLTSTPIQTAKYAAFVARLWVWGRSGCGAGCGAWSLEDQLAVRL